MANLSITPNDAVTFGILYQDDDVLVIEKRSGLVTQPGKGHLEDSLLNGLFSKWGTALQNLGAVRDYGLLHRLDRETSGLLVAALTRAAYDGLRPQFEERRIKKFYWAVTSKTPRQADGLIDRALAEVEPKAMGDKKLSRLASISKGPRVGGRGTAKPAQTAYRVLASSDMAALLECRPLTGRLHQVRVHLVSIGCSILGDGLYAPGAVAAAAPRLALHAHRLVFEHPITGATVDVRSPMPRDLRAVLRKMKLALPEGVDAAGPNASEKARAAVDGEDA